MLWRDLERNEDRQVQVPLHGRVRVLGRGRANRLLWKEEEGDFR